MTDAYQPADDGEGSASRPRDSRTQVQHPGPPSGVLSPAVIVLIAVFFLLLAVMLMVAVPLLNISLLSDSVADLGDLATWQITANVTMVGMLVTGVFVITALRMEQSAKYTAWNEARQFLRETQEEFEKGFEGQLDSWKQTIGEALDETLKNAKEAHAAALEKSQEEHRKLLKEHEGAMGSLMAFVDAKGTDLLSDLSDSEVRENIRRAVLRKIEDDAARKALIEDLCEELMAKHGAAIAERVAADVVAQVRWRWLFRQRRQGGPAGRATP